MNGPRTAPKSAPMGLVAALQSMRDRMMAALTPKFGDAFDGDFDTMLEAINALKKRGTPPSAPVGVPSDILRIVETAIDVCNDRDRPAMAEDLEAVRLYVEQASAAIAKATGEQA